jgi:hypothetical protein
MNTGGDLFDLISDPISELLILRRWASDIEQGVIVTIIGKPMEPGKSA